MKYKYKEMKIKMNIIFSAVIALSVIASGSCSKSETGGHNPWTGGGNGGGTTNPSSPYAYSKSSEKTIRLMTYNSYYCKGNSSDPTKNGFSEQNTANFARVIKALAPDMVAIQELDWHASDRGNRELLNDIATATGEKWKVVFGAAADYAGGKIGPGLLISESALTRLGFKNVTTVPIAGNEKRILIIAEFEKFVFIATHLDTDDTQRKSSAYSIINEADKFLGSKPVFLAGDLNDSPAWSGGGAAFPVLQEKFVIKSAVEGSLPAQPSQTIDYILYDANGTDFINFEDTHVVKSMLFGSSLERLDTVSDHYPVILDINLK